MKLTIKLFLVLIIAASTITADDGNMGNGGYDGDGNMGNGGRTCTVNCPEPTPDPQDPDATETQTSSQTTSQTGGDGSIFTIIDEYLKSLFG